MPYRKKTIIWVTSLFLCLLFIRFPTVSGAMTIEEEKKLGKKILFEMEKKVDWVKDLTLQSFINTIGQSLVAQVGSTPFDFKFYLIVGTDPNAYAIPGGHIFLTTGLLVSTENEQEIAGVVSHEISHVMARHVAQMIERSKRLNIASIAAIIAGALLGGGGKASEAVAVTAMATVEALALKYTREMEVEADQNGLQYMIRAGYDPNGFITFMSKIYKLSLTSGPGIPTYLSTHPAIGDRISLMENLLQTGPKPSGPFKTFGSFRKIQAKAFVEEREPHVAINHFQSLIDASPQEVDAHYGLGLAYRKMGRLDKALEVFHHALLLAPKDVDILRELGITSFLSGKMDQAIKNLEAVRSLYRNGDDRKEDLLSLYYLGKCYQEKGDFSRALPLFLRVKQGFPEWVEVYHSLGSVYGRMDQKGLSHLHFARYFKLKGEPKNALLHYRTSLEWLGRGSPEREEAQREIRELGGSK
ncbi:MAG: tetratricopeptide repeat protein [Deltaproteobacteria bacterium]|nr:tetratricopeptide repeat protein [Deltaproteobacteria bacterium]MBM4322925.1 tetratricopeptide repeat protein [Deltaproteobacteria bacterium]